MAPARPAPQPILGAAADAARTADALFAGAWTEDSYRTDWQSAIQHATQEEGREAYPLLIDLIASTRFDDLTTRQQHAGLLLAGLLGMNLNDNIYAHHLLVRSSAMAEAIPMDWHARLAVAFTLNDRDDSLLSITGLVRSWPADAATLNPQAMRRLVNPEPENEAQRQLRVQTLTALFDASYKVEWGFEPSWFWVDLALELTQRGDLNRAARVVMRINQPRALLAMRVDRRFDGLVGKYPGEFDLRAASKREIEEAERGARTYPRSLDAVVQLSYADLDVGRYAEVLKRSDDVLARATAAGGAQALYDDGRGRLEWIYSTRAQAFRRLHRAQDAEKEYQRAAREPEDGGRNVSGVINLAEFYAVRDRGEAAVQVLALLPPARGTTSPYGSMQVQDVRLAAALSMHNDSEVQASITYLREHQDDALGTFQSALLRANLLDEAAQLLIRRLQTPALRGEALREIQDYLPVDDPPSVQQENARLEQILRRSQVKAAIDAVGRREKVALPPPA